MKILIIGLLRHNSGKTTLALALSRYLKELGYKVGVFKPLSFHNWYYQYSTSIENIKKKLLFSEDVMKLAEAVQTKLPYELLNPIHGVIFPPNPLLLRYKLVARYYLYLENQLMAMPIVRFTLYSNVKFNIYVINRGTLYRDHLYYDLDYIDSILKSADIVIDVYTTDQIYKAMQIYGPISIRSCYSCIKKLSKVVIIESLSNTAAPSVHVLDTDLVLAVGPGVVMVYDGKSYSKAVLVYSSLRSVVEVSTQDIINLISPIKVFSIPPLLEDELLNPYILRAKFKDILLFIERKIKEER